MKEEINRIALWAISSGSPPLMRIPFWAPTPVPTMTAVGVASPREQGHAMDRTVMDAWKAKRTMTSALDMLGLYPCEEGDRKRLTWLSLHVETMNDGAHAYREVLPHDIKVDEPDCQPGHQRQQRDEDDEGHEVAAELVCKLLDGGLRGGKGVNVRLKSSA